MREGPGSGEEWREFARQLAVNLRRRRDAAGLTQERVAEMAGISLYAYQTYERGTAQGQAVNPRLATVLTICQALDVPIEELLPDVPRLVAKTVRRDSHATKQPVLSPEQAVAIKADLGADSSRLTVPEEQILNLIASGMTASEIASLLELSNATVEDYVRRIRAKLTPVVQSATS